jgi:cell division septum initiation protein DivIVA
MSSRIEQFIDEIEDYIETCKPQILSSTKIVVDREQLEELIAELRSKTPEEIKRYQKIISNKDAILADAQAKADEIIAQAQIQTNELVSEHQIMQQAYAQANEVVMIATKQAQEILDNATNEANNIRMGAMVYTDSQLKGMEDVLTGAIDTTRMRYDNLISSLQGYLDVVSANRAQLFPSEPEPEYETSPEPPAAPSNVETVSLSEVPDSGEDDSTPDEK